MTVPEGCEMLAFKEIVRISRYRRGNHSMLQYVSSHAGSDIKYRPARKMPVPIHREI